MTYSIVGFDPVMKEWGIAVQSKFLGVGAVVPWAKAGVGAVATQSYANTLYGPKALELMASGKSAQQTIDNLTQEDDQRDLRQVGIVDAHGNAATFTGVKCYDWAGGLTGRHYAAQGNILVSKDTVQAMATAFEQSEGTGSLAERLLTALDAGQEAGGDSRGMQSACLLVVKENGGYGGFNDRYIDLRVEDHPDPIKELTRIYYLHRLYFSRTKANNILDIMGEVKAETAEQLRRLGYIEKCANVSDEQLFQALTAYIHKENLEEREQERGKIDREVLEYMKMQN
jgi:uncharacterized Ntn-hydrolase superfamily protein